MIKHNGKAVTDIKVIQNKAQVDVNKAVWNGVTVWQRVIPMDQNNTTITINPTSYSGSDVYRTWGNDYKPEVTSVKVNGVELASGQYSVTGYSDHTGHIYGDHKRGTTVSSTGKVTISGKNGYSGSAYKEYPCSYTYSPYNVVMKVYERKKGTTAYTAATTKRYHLGNCKINSDYYDDVFLEEQGGFVFIYNDASIYQNIVSATIALIGSGTYLITVDGFGSTMSTSPTITGDVITEDMGSSAINIYITY